MNNSHKACPFPTVEKAHQVWCDECRKWTDPKQENPLSRTIRFQPYEGGGVLITEREVVGLKHGARSSRKVWNEQRVVIEASDIQKLMKVLQDASGAGKENR